MTESKKDSIRLHLHDIFRRIGCDTPRNHRQILEFVASDVHDAADPDEWHSGDVDIAFRRWMEEQTIPEDE